MTPILAMHGWNGCKLSCGTFLTRRVGNHVPKKLLEFQLFLVANTILLFSILPVVGSAQDVESVILDIAWSPDGTMLASIGNDGILDVMAPSQNNIVFHFIRPSTLLKAAVVWSPLGDRLATGIGNRMDIWDVDSWQLLYEYEVGSPSGFFTWGL